MGLTAIRHYRRKDQSTWRQSKRNYLNWRGGVGELNRASVTHEITSNLRRKRERCIFEEICIFEEKGEVYIWRNNSQSSLKSDENYKPTNPKAQWSPNRINKENHTSLYHKRNYGSEPGGGRKDTLHTEYTYTRYFNQMKENVSKCVRCRKEYQIPILGKKI